MYIDFDLDIIECNIAGAACEGCKKKKRSKNLRIVRIEINSHFFTEVVLCTKCLVSTNLVRLRK